MNDKSKSQHLKIFVILSLLFIISFSIFQNTSAQSTRYTWKSVIAGGGGFVPGIVYHPTVPGLVYARTDIGGAYRWDYSTSRWIPLNDMMTRNNADYMGILSIGLDRNDPNRVYLQCGKYTQSWAGNGAMLCSTDRGDSWTIHPLPVKIGGNEDGRGTGERLQVDPNSGSVLFMGTTANGLWKSTNYGSSWAKVSSFFPDNVNFVRFVPSSGSLGNATQRVFVAAANTSGQSLYRSDNGGTTWSIVQGQPTGVMALRADIVDTLLYLAFSDNVGPNQNASQGSVWKYHIDSGNWVAITPPTGQGGFSCISVYPKNANYIIVSTLDRWWPKDEIYRSTDGGKTWKSCLTNATLDHRYAPYTAGNINPHWITCLAMDPFDSTKAMFGTGYGIWACDNLNATTPTWYFRDENLEETVPMQIISPPFINLLSTMGDYDGFRHDNLDVSPPDRHYPYKGTTLSIAFAGKVPSKIVKAYNAKPYGAYSTDGGETWNDFKAYPAGTSEGGSWTIAISADGNTLVWGPPGASMSYSTNNGTSWTACGGGVPRVPPIADRINPNRFYAYNSVSGQLWVSIDGGKTFSPDVGGLPTVPTWSTQEGNVAAVPGDEGDLWICCASGGLYRSMDSGANAEKISTVTSAYRLGFGRALIAGRFPAIYLFGTVAGVLGFFRSDDVGATWIRINDDNHQFGWIHQITGDPRVYGRCYVSAEGRGILYGQSEYSDTTNIPSSFKFLSASSDSIKQAHQNITVFWSRASHPQGELLTYVMHFFGPDVDTTFTSIDTTVTFSVGNVQPLSTYVLTGEVSSGFDTTASSNSIILFTSSLSTDVAEMSAEVIKSYTLYQNYPNPFNPQTTISYSLLRTGIVTLKVYDVSGREVVTLLNKQRTAAGNHEVSFDAASLPSGVYLYRLEIGNFSDTKKTLVLK